MTVVNTTKHLVTIYPWVTDVDAKEGESGTTDLAGTREKALGESLSRWIEITRGSIDLLPGEQKEVPITVQINLNAKPGLYHAVIHASAGPDRPTAEALSAETVDIAVNIEVLDDVNERLELASFVPTKGVFGDGQASFEYSIKNIGNRGEVPRGKIRIYDKGGREIASVDANEDGTRLEPSAKELISSVWASGGTFGKYKAMLDLEYGQRGTLQDTVFFWVVPWKKVALMFLSLIVLCVAAAIVLHSYGQSRRRAFAAAGGIYDEEEWEEPSSRYESEGRRSARYIDELREVLAPPPTHTISRSTVASAPRLMSGGVDAASHKVVLGKKESPRPSPEHIVNLKR
jgi:hypothetical protein